MNYTGRLKVRYMVQQRNIQKYSEDDHYCNALYKHAREMAIQFKEPTSFLSTDDKNKIKVGELNCPIPAVARGRKVLLVQDKLCKQLINFSSITSTSTVVLMNEIPEKVDDS